MRPIMLKHLFFTFGILVLFLSAHAIAQVNSQVSSSTIVSTVAELINQVSQGGRVEIAAGRYVLDESLKLSNDIELIGAGRDRTFIVSTAENFSIGFEGNGNFKAQGITFEHQGELGAHVVWVHDGVIAIDNCAFVGGVLVWREVEVQLIKTIAKSEAWGGSGLLLTGNATGTVSNSIFENNAVDGISVRGKAQPRLEQNTLRNNEDGIFYSGNARGTAVGNTIEENSSSGISVADEAQPRLEQNTIRNNSKQGIVYTSNAGGVAVRNTIEENSLFGIAVSNEAQPRLEQNIIRSNGEQGIVYTNNAGGIAISNISEGNGEDGIATINEAQPRLENNILRNNGYYGIFAPDSLLHIHNSYIGQNTFSGNKKGDSLESVLSNPLY